MFWSHRSKRISLGGTWLKHKCFGGTGRNVSHLVELFQNLDVFCRAGRNVSRLVEPGRNIDFSVVPIKTYLAWSNLVET